LVLLDDQLRVVWVNKAFFDTFLVGAEIVGQPLEQVWNARASHEELFAQLERAATEGKPFSGVVVEHPFGRASSQRMRLGAHPIPADGDRPTLTLVTMEEM
ncbi:MAG: hypothetical protein H6Q89_3309, partial [Myxococcaceae bacterium]|nr:hypothetical protein [Myxococcaceae bacterium]